jgi:hypothetical protein
VFGVHEKERASGSSIRQPDSRFGGKGGKTSQRPLTTKLPRERLFERNLLRRGNDQNPTIAARLTDRYGRLRVKTEIPNYMHRGEINENDDEFYS